MTVLNWILFVLAVLGCGVAAFFIVKKYTNKDSVLASISIIIDFIRKAEAMFPETGAGAMKKSWVLEQINNFGAESLEKIGNLIDSLVSFMNTFGWAK